MFASKKPSAIIGPSHAIRWSWHVRDDVVRCGLPHERIIGLGGAPIWSSTLLERATSEVGHDDHLTVMVPDFRFGNAILLDHVAREGGVMQDGFLGIDSTAMTGEHDLAMFDRSIAGLQQWHQRFGKRVRYIFWCLFGRQVHDRMAGRHIQSGAYRHPAFNYDEITRGLPSLDIVDLSPLLRLPMHDVRRLYIDSSSHPSQIGYLLLNGMLFDDLNAMQAYEKAVAEVETSLLKFARRAASAKKSRVVLTGRSVWLDTLMGYMSRQSIAKLAEAGLILAPLDAAPGQPAIAQIIEDMDLDGCAVVVVSAGGSDLSRMLAHAFRTEVEAWKNVPYFDWESAAIAAITRRTEVPRFMRLDPELPVQGDAITTQLRPDMVEQGPLGMPSWTGILHVLELIGSDKIPGVRQPSVWKKPVIASAIDHRIEGEALITKDDIAFLIGGNHDVLKYITGERTPKSQSFDAFAGNIAGRCKLAREYGASYAHVIFPDKQSVMTEAFPLQPIRRLGDEYISRLPSTLKTHVLYPADHLRSEIDPPFLPLDTHMTDHGSLAVLRMMLAAIGLEADHALSRIRRRITKFQRWTGDLGNKFTPALYQEGLLLDPDWSITEFRSPGGFNDGMVDIIFSPEGVHDRTLLLFGDSFFRMMLKHLGAVFTRVICLRTRFLHPEMVTLIRPDIIVTGNAERYLSNVSPDEEAQAFALYPYLRGSSDLIMNKDFLEAWAAVTAPYSSRARNFMAQHGVRPTA